MPAVVVLLSVIVLMKKVQTKAHVKDAETRKKTVAVKSKSSGDKHLACKVQLLRVSVSPSRTANS